jgi:hypothetical protein
MAMAVTLPAGCGDLGQWRKGSPNRLAWRVTESSSTCGVASCRSKELDGSSRRFPLPRLTDTTMKHRLLFAGVLLASASCASAQVPSQDLPDASNPTSSPPAAADTSKSGRTDRPPAANPNTNAPSPAATGQTRAPSEKMEPEMDSVGAGRSSSGEERK